MSIIFLDDICNDEKIHFRIYRNISHIVFCGTGAMTVSEITNGSDLTHTGVAIVWGLIVMAMIYAFGEISGAHFNPAVTISFAYAKKFAWKEVPKYITAQVLGALLASGILWFLFPTSEFYGATIPTLDVWRAFVLRTHY